VAPLDLPGATAARHRGRGGGAETGEIERERLRTALSAAGWGRDMGETISEALTTGVWGVGGAVSEAKPSAKLPSGSACRPVTLRHAVRVV
jgi:hypothetical protein